MSSLRLVLLLSLAATLFGCTFAVQDTGYLSDYSSFNMMDGEESKFRLYEEEDFSLDKYFLTKAQLREHEEAGTLPPDAMADGVDLSSAHPVLFIVDEPAWRTETRLEPAQESEVLFVIRERLYRFLLREYPHPARVRWAYAPSDPLFDGYRVIHIETAVTHVKKGDGMSRFFIGYGVGATTMQLEGKFFEGPNKDKLLGEFALRNDHGGYPNGFLNPRVFKVYYCLKYAAEKILREYVGELRNFLPVVTPDARGLAPGTLAPEVIAPAP